MSNITEELFGAIKLITDNAINKISLDKTIICRITDASKKSEGKYRVQNGDVSFYAFSEDATYAKDDEVRVVVPGDDTKQKYILGKYVKDDGSPVNYVSPADSVINISGNILSGNGNADRGFIAAKNAKSTIEIITNMANAGNILGTTVYDTLVIQGDFRTLLQEDSSGEYGIDVIIYGTKNDIVTAQSYTLSSADMFGNPYNFQIYTPQAKAFSLPESLGEEIEVIGVKVAFYQRGFSKQQLLNYDNVLIRNLSIWFGSDTSKVEDKTSKIYTTDSLSYKYYDPTEITNQKTIKLLWYKKDENDKFIECDFDGESNGFTLLENQQIDNKIKAQMGKEDGPKTKRQLYAAAALQDNKSVSSSLVKLLGSDLQLLIRNMESEAGLVSGSLQLTDGKTPLYKIGSTIDQYTSALGTWLTNNSSPNGEWKASPDKNIDQFVNTNVISFLDTFFTSVPSEMSNSTGTFEIYKAKWQVLRKKIKIIYKKLNVTSFGGNNFAQMTSGAWLEDFSTEASKETAAADPKYSCFWFVYDEQYDDDNVRVSVAGEHWKSIEEMDNLTEITYDCDPVLKTQQFKCIVFEDANYYESNILEFTNSDDIPNGATLDQADSLVLVHGAKYSRDNYLLYGDDGYLIENRDSSLIRTIACEYDGIKAGNEALNGATVYWYLPSASTMLRKAYTNDNDYKTKCDLTLQTQGAAASKYPNHYCYSRTITYDETEETFDSSNEFYYCLAEFYEPNASDNSIICEVYLIDETKQTANDPVFARKWFTIGQRGTCGTGYTLSVTHAEDQIATTNSNNLILNIKLFDESGNEVPLDKSNNEKYTVEWLNHEGSTKDSFNLDEDVLTIYAGHYGILKISKSIFITDSTGTNKRQINLSILYAIPWASSEEYLFSGCTKVIYTTLGTLDYTSMYKTPYSLTTRDGVDQEATWRIVLKDDASKDESYYPQLRNNCLLPASMYLTGLRGWCYVEAVSGSASLWKQPIIIMQGKYGSSVLNDWDGSFQIDENAGTVMGTMFAAGKKTSNNTFEGVIMGDVQVGLNDYSQGKIGLYGYNDGVQSFGFKVDGTAFIGKSGKGQIIFDGNQGIIGDAGENMEINFTDGTIKATKFTLDARSNNYTTGLYMTNGMGQSDNPVFWVKQDNNNQISYENNRIIIAASGDGGKVIIDSLGQLNNSYFYAGNDNNYIQLTATGLNILTKKIIIDALVGEETKTGLYLDSSKATFKLISSNNWITFENGSLDIATNKILINAWVGSAGLYINTAPNTEASSKEKYYFIVGKDEDNCIRLSSGEEGLDIKTKKIIINAWNEDTKSGFYLDSNGEAPIFRVASSDTNKITFEDGSLDIATEKIVIDAWSGGESEETGIHLDSTKPDFFIGKKTIFEDENERNIEWFRSLYTEKGSPEFLEYKDGKVSIGGWLYAYGGNVGALEITEKGLSITSDPGADSESSTWYGLFNEGVQYQDEGAGKNLQFTITYNFDTSEQINDIDISRDNQESVVFFSNSDIQDTGDKKNVQNVSVVITDKITKSSLIDPERKYITWIKVIISFTTTRGLPSPPGAVGKIHFIKKIDPYRATSITADGIITSSLVNLDVSELKADVTQIKKVLGISSSSETDLLENAVVNKISFRLQDEDGAWADSDSKLSELPNITGLKYQYHPPGNQADVSFIPGIKVPAMWITGRVYADPKWEIEMSKIMLYDGILYYGYNNYHPVIGTEKYELYGSGSTFKDPSVFISGEKRTIYNEKNTLQLTFDDDNYYLQNDSSEKFFNISSSGLSTLKMSAAGFSIAKSSLTLSVNMYKNESENLTYLDIPGLLVSKICATPTLWVNTIKDSNGTNEVIKIASSSVTLNQNAQVSGSLTISGDITNNNHTGKLGKLAFADSVKKNFDISVSGDVTLEVDVSEYYTADKDYYWEDYYVVNSNGGSGTVTFTHDASKDGQTETQTYYYDTYEGRSRKVYYTKATTKSVTKNVTLKGNTDLELEPSDADTGTETIEITGTQQ